jgi:hypothetical protein
VVVVVVVDVEVVVEVDVEELTPPAACPQPAASSQQLTAARATRARRVENVVRADPGLDMAWNLAEL